MNLRLGRTAMLIAIGGGIAVLLNDGTAPFDFSVVSGTLPPGASLGTNGRLTGTPSTPGNFTFTVQQGSFTTQLFCVLYCVVRK